MSSLKTCLILVGLMVVPIIAAAQRATEWQIHGLASVGGDRFLGGGVGLALRTNGRMRVGMVLNAGDLEGSAAVRPELLGSYHLNPYKRQAPPVRLPRTTTVIILPHG